MWSSRALKEAATWLETIERNQRPLAVNQFSRAPNSFGRRERPTAVQMCKTAAAQTIVSK